MLFEESVMQYIGVPHIPTFANPTGEDPPKKVKGLGDACHGTKIEGCKAWFQERAPKRTVNGKELRMVITENDLATHFCRICKG